MGVDLAAIREKIAQLNGQRNQSNIQMWKPGIGEYKIRILPWKDVKEGEIFKELWFYYLGEERGLLAPNQFNKPDPIHEMMRRLYSSGKPEEKNMANKLRPKMRSYAAVIVRGDEESKGVQVWAFGKPVHARLLSFWVDPEIGDVTDPVTGYDLKVTISHIAGKMFNGKPSLNTNIDPTRRSSKLSDDPEQAKQWLESLPDLNNLWQQKSSQEIETALNNWMSAGGGKDDTSDGSQRGSVKGDELDDLVNAVKDNVKASSNGGDATKHATKLKPKKPTVDEDDKAAAAPKQDLDAAFAELMEDE